MESWRAASPGLLLGWCLVAAAVATVAIAPYAHQMEREGCALVGARDCPETALVTAAAWFGALAISGAVVVAAREWWRRDGWVALCFGPRVRAWGSLLAGAALATGAMAFALDGARARVSFCQGPVCESHTSPYAVVWALAGMVVAFAGALLAAQGVTSIASSRRGPRSPRPRPQAPSPSPSPDSSR